MAKPAVLSPGEGAFYKPSPPPQIGDLEGLRQWCEREYSRIAFAINEGRQPLLRLDVAAVLPNRAFSGMVCYFAAGVAGTKEGTYEFAGGTWTKL